MRLGNEFRLQTKEGAEWDREFRNRQSKLSNNDPDLQIRRDGLLCAEAYAIVRSLKITQGTAKEPRPLIIHREPTPPVVNGDGLPVWIRDGWSASEKEFVDEARRAGADSPTIYVFIPKQSPDQLRGFISDADAAQQTIDFKGVPNGQEGIEAQQSMASRRDLAVQQRDTLVKQIVANAKVFQGGGSELLRVTLDDRLREATEASLVRMFPRFKEADAPSSAWEAVIKRARAGADQAFQPVGHSGPAEQHSVCKQVLDAIGAGKLGTEIRRALKASPYGWPQDAIDAALIELHRSQHISAVLNGSAVAIGQLDQNRISKAEFRVERTTLPVQDRLALRRLFGLVKIQATSNNLGEKAPEFLSALIGLANSAGGPPPLPVAPATAEVEDLRRLIGNEQLAAIRAVADQFERKIGEWIKLKEIADRRKPVWGVVERLARHAVGVAAAADPLEQVEAIRNGRMLLDNSDPATPVRAALAGALRQAVTQAHAAHEKAYQSAGAMLDANSTWQGLGEADRKNILSEVGLTAPAKLDVSSDEALLSSLDQSPLAARQAQGDAVAGRIQRVLELAAKMLEPKIRRVSVESATLGDADAVRAWVARQEAALLDAVKQGPIFVG